MKDTSQRWLIAAQAFQSLMMIAIVFGFSGIRMTGAVMFSQHIQDRGLPALTQWILEWGPDSTMSTWALGISCAVTYMFLSLLAIVKSNDATQALARCYALASVWLFPCFYLLILIISGICPFVSITKLTS